MSILSHLPYSSIIADPFCDYLNVTVPHDQQGALRALLEPLVESLGPFESFDDGYRLFEVRDGSLVPAGSLKIKKRGQVCLCSASGQVLLRLRMLGLFDEYLLALSQFPHRVSMLHATADYSVHGPAFIPAVYAAAKSGDLALTRKRIQSDHVKALLSPDSCGDDTGTVYLGKRQNADVWAKVYDKRQERLDNSYSDPGPCVRVEVAIQSGIGATLRDAADPSAIFWHFAGRSLVQAPPSFNGWVPQGEGYSVPPKPQRSLFERMQAVADHSLDVGRLLRLAYEAAGSVDGALKHINVLLRPRLASLAAPSAVPTLPVG